MALSTVDYTLTFNLTTTPKQFDFEDTTDYAGQSINSNNVTLNLIVTDPSSFVIFSGNVTPETATANLCQIPLDTNGNPLQGTYTINATYTVAATTLDPSYDVTSNKSIVYEYSSPTVVLDMEVDCITPELTSTDNTPYTYKTITPTITRVHEIHYPPSLNVADVTGTGQTLSTNTFYTLSNSPLPYSSSLTSTLTYNLTNGFYIEDEIEGSGYINVTCDGQICDLYCCIKAQYNRWNNSKNNAIESAKELQKLHQMIALSSLVGYALQCSMSADVSSMVTQILEIGNCEPGCGCDDTPQLVTGLGVGGGTVIVEAGSGITVTSATNGNQTTYTVSLQSSLLSKLNSLKNTVVSAGSGISVSSKTVGDTITYTVTSTGTDTNILTMIYDVSLALGQVPTITLESYKKYGTLFNIPTNGTLVNDNNGSGAAFQEAINSFTFSGFLYAGSGNFYPMTEILYAPLNDPTGNPTPLPVATSQRAIDLNIYDYSTDTFSMRFVDKSGNPVQGYDLNWNYDKFKIIIKIIA